MGHARVPPKDVVLQELRALVGLTQEELAEKMGGSASGDLAS
jgi:DNA-binding XRE family transcriptional regulator